MQDLTALLEKARSESASRPDMGRKVRVVKGRKVPLGTEGIVVYNALHNIHNRGRLVNRVRRVGIEDASGTVHYTAASNVVVIV